MKKTDNNSFAPYKHNKEVETLVAHMKEVYYVNLMDRALEEKLWISDPKEFQKILNLYNSNRAT